MVGEHERKIQWAISLSLIMLYFSGLPAHAKYSGGTGEPNDPYQIATAADLIALGDSPKDYDKHFILTADIDLDPNLSGRKVFEKAVIPLQPDPNFGRTPKTITFTGVFDGSGHTISHLTIRGVNTLGLFGQLGSGAMVSNLGLEAVDVNGEFGVGGLVGVNGGVVKGSYSTGAVSGVSSVGGLVGSNGGSIAASYSKSTVTGYFSCVGGLVGENYGSITASYSTGTVTGNLRVGGLAGDNLGSITTSYSSGTVTGTGDGTSDVGGLVGHNEGIIIMSYSTGTVTAYTDAGGLVGRNNEGGNITSSFWDIETSGQAESAGGEGKTTAEMQTASTFLDAGWDFMDETANGTEDIWWILEGQDYPRLWWEYFIVVDDFESYNDLYPSNPESNQIFNTWIDGYAIPTNGSLVGCDFLPRGCLEIIHSGNQSMPFWYGNTHSASYSEATRTFSHAQDWTEEGVGVLSLWFYGDPNNAPEPMYVGIANANGPTAVVYHDNPDVVLINEWTEWRINLQEFANQGVDLTNVSSISIGFGDKNSPPTGGLGRMYFDDIRLY
ncbi:MAG: GLUG motif-containing protein [Planctomycetota bacterium]